jgi:hypothetical protein
MTGFGQIHPLPGIWPSLHLDTAVTLPIGVEAYAAFALRVWLTANSVVSDRTRRFARRSAIAALVLGMAGQVAYHLLAQAGITRAPWEVTTVVACLPVLVLGMGSALAHLLRSDAAATPAPDRSDGQGPRGANGVYEHEVRHLPSRERLRDAYAAAARIVASGQHVSRRTLRSAGLHGSNTELGTIARVIRTSRPRTRDHQWSGPDEASAIRSSRNEEDQHGRDRPTRETEPTSPCAPAHRGAPAANTFLTT